MKYVFLLLLVVSNACDAAVKLSKSGICHPSASRWYDKTNASRIFENMESCLAVGRVAKFPSSQKKASNGYDRHSYEHWISRPEDNGLNVRHALLEKQSLVKPIREEDYIKHGRWYCPYSGKTFYNSNDLDIDHVVPLAFADNHGAREWSVAEKRQFANDPQNLIIVWDSLNQQKSALPPWEWLPPNAKFRCQYISRFTQVILKYNLTLSNREAGELKQLLTDCQK